MRHAEVVILNVDRRGLNEKVRSQCRPEGEQGWAKKYLGQEWFVQSKQQTASAKVLMQS